MTARSASLPETFDSPNVAIDAYFEELSRLGQSTSVIDRSGQGVPLGVAIDRVVDRALDIAAGPGKLVFIGNGGSAAIASHMAIDYAKNGSLRAMAFNDAAALTCLSNDLGYENVFSTQIGIHGQPGDLLMAISSSGRSPNILNAVAAARGRDMEVVTLSGFSPDNALRGLGDLNFFVDSTSYGFVEITHLSLIHAVLDQACGGENSRKTS